MASFAEEVAECSGRELDRVSAVLEEAGIEAQPTAAAPVSLQITRLAFSGTKRREGRDDEPIEFEQSFDTDFWVITSEGNLVGKSTILRVIQWAMTGREGDLTADVRSWITRVELEGVIGADAFTIRFDNDDGTVEGALAAGIETPFDSATFQEVTESFFMDRLGFDATPFWQKRPQGLEEEGDASRHGWPAYFAAIYLPQANPGVLLGQHNVGGLPGTLLQVFLGLPWARTSAAARIAENRGRMQHSAAARRAAEDAGAREQRLEPLRKELEETQAALVELEAAAPDVTPTVADSTLSAFTAALGQRRSTADSVARSEATLALAVADRDEAHKRLQALREETVVRPLIGHLAPTMCPRCNTEVTKERRDAEEHTGSCSVCTEPLEDLEIDEAEIEEAEGALKEAEQAVSEAEKARDAANEEAAAAEAAQVEAEAAMARIEEAKPVQEDVRAAETKIAHLEGQLTHLQAVEVEFVEDDDREIITCAKKVAETRRADAAGELLDELGSEICALGQGFGIPNLEEAHPKLNANLKLKVGGADTNFGALDPGERLRIRLATVIALIRVGQRRGVGRHPGLLLIDTPGGEEMEDADVAAILEQMGVLAAETDNLQIICATARAEQVRELVDEARIIHGPGYGELW